MGVILYIRLSEFNKNIINYKQIIFIINILFFLIILLITDLGYTNKQVKLKKIKNFLL